MTLDDTQRQVLIQHKLERAKISIADVRFLIDNGKLIIAVSRMYYGMFYALSALAVKHRFSTTKHKQLIGWFNKNFVKEHKVDRKLGEFLHTAYDMRSKGDYDDFVHFSLEEVEELFQEMQEFIRAIERLVQEARESDE